MYGRLAYKFEGMTDMINGAFMEDLSELLNSATGDQRRRKTFYEIDTEFEKMTASLLKNFNSMASLMPFFRASLRQTMIRKLASVGKDKDGWKKADEHLTTLMDQEPEISGQDTAAELAALKATTKAQDAKTCTRQRVSALLSFSQAISGGFQCGAHPHDVRVLPVSLIIKIHSLRF